MLDVFECGALLFESKEDGEELRVGCAVTPEGALEIEQVSEGPLTFWCFEETPHKVKVVVEPLETDLLLAYFHLDEPCQLPAVLRLEYTGYDCAQRIRQLMRRLGVDYHVDESPIVR